MIRIQPVLYVTEEEYNVLTELASAEHRSITSMIRHIVLTNLKEIANG